MKILIFSDIHWSQNTSILRKQGNKYSIRLELLVNTLNWINKIALDYKCSAMICAGDMMDRSDCSDIELTSLKDIIWNGLPCYFLVGNHESSVVDLRYTTLKPLESSTNKIISSPMNILLDNSQIHFIPYVTEDMRKPLKDYLLNIDNSKHQIIISHNDLKGIRYGKYESKNGFDIKEIESMSDLYINGHLHNGGWVTKKILNLGSSTAHNFSNDSFNFNYGVWVLDTDTLELEFIENPYSLNFYKIEINTREDFNHIKNIKNYAVISIKCVYSLKEELKEILDKDPRILTYKLIICMDSKDETISETQVELKGIDYIDKFKEFIQTNLGNDSIVMEELSEVCK